ncbi:MAG: hypothetical protein AVDCRST_MAG28-2760 [uncultured Rubrobacteraceae bacterium]|uniref:Uncharacterized protein n=1 Tax=uncultured Rubrobacteraceae bacterium TaxID=349277 RepID=A0A6J4QWU9_9ACTN|nr:MAG: hypothetical protein AVDCRST_MAG28-2760 [uncultured Rubrobacteraceae bacterium]
MQPSLTPGDDASGSWYELGRLYAAAGEDTRKATSGGFVVAFVVAAQVLLSAPLFGTSWAGPFAALIPLTAGLLFGGGSLWWRRAKFSKRREALRRKLAMLGEDANRPTARGLGAYYDTQLILLRCEYELLRSRRTKRTLLQARLLETSFGFTPEDGFECGPLNVAPDTPKMKALRERWEVRLSAKRTLPEASPPSLGLEEDVNYRVFPREMTVSTELAVRGAYLRISCHLLRESYGEKPETASGEIRRRARRDLEEYAAITGRRAR